MALDFPRSGALHGATAVDYQCHRQSGQSGAGGSFRGFLARAGEDTNLESAVGFRNRELPVVNARVSLINEDSASVLKICFGYQVFFFFNTRPYGILLKEVRLIFKFPH